MDSEALKAALTQAVGQQSSVSQEDIDNLVKIGDMLVVVPDALRWRVGSKVGRTLYRGHGNDDLIGVMDSRIDALFVANSGRSLSFMFAIIAKLLLENRELRSKLDDQK